MVLLLGWSWWGGFISGVVLLLGGLISGVVLLLEWSYFWGGLILGSFCSRVVFFLGGLKFPVILIIFVKQKKMLIVNLWKSERDTGTICCTVCHETSLENVIPVDFCGKAIYEKFILWVFNSRRK